MSQFSTCMKKDDLRWVATEKNIGIFRTRDASGSCKKWVMSKIKTFIGHIVSLKIFKNPEVSRLHLCKTVLLNFWFEN